MDIQKLFEKLVDHEEIKDMPITDVFKVFFCIVDIISSGECYYDSEEKKVMDLS